MMKPMSTGGVQWMELRSCNEQEEYDMRSYTPKVMPSEHYGECGIPHQWENNKNRTASLFHQRLLLQWVSCVPVVLCLLSLSSSFLCCAATDDTKAILATITDCFPNVVLFPSQLMYHCEVKNANALSTFSLRYGYYLNGELISAWDATIVNDSSFIAFQPDSGAPLGERSLVILRYHATETPTYMPVTNTFIMTFMSFFETTASLPPSNVYYGLKAMVQTNFPTTITIPQYLLVPSQADSGTIEKNCAAAGGHNLATSAFLPMPGSYSLCVTANKWRGYYLPWGKSTLEVRGLLPDRPYMRAVGKKKLVILDAITTASVTDMKNVFLVRCPDKMCRRVTSSNGERAVSVDVCTGSSKGDRVRLSTEDNLLSTAAGVYAVCVEVGTELEISPAALPLTVVQDTFTFNTVVKSDTLVTIAVSGGDLSWRGETYEVCAMPLAVSCDSVTLVQDAVCVRSEFPSSPSVDVDISSLREKYAIAVYKVVICFVSSNVTVNGRRYILSHDVRQPFLLDDGSLVKSKPKISPVVLIVGITIAVVTAIVILVHIVCCVRWYWRQKLREKVEEDILMYELNANEMRSMRSRPSMRRSNSIMRTGSIWGLEGDMRSDSMRRSDSSVRAYSMGRYDSGLRGGSMRRSNSGLRGGSMRRSNSSLRGGSMRRSDSGLRGGSVW